MQRLALAFALGAVVAAALPSPGLFLALGLGIAAIGTGWAGYAQRRAPGMARLMAAAAIDFVQTVLQVLAYCLTIKVAEQ